MKLLLYFSLISCCSILSAQDDMYPDFNKDINPSTTNFDDSLAINSLTNQSLKTALIRFNEVRVNGMILQLLGVGVGIIGVSSVTPFAAIIGGSFALVGFLIEMGAGRHIRKLEIEQDG